MFDSKFVITLLGLIIAVFAICNISKSSKIQESFGMNPSQVWKIDRTVAASPEAARKGDFYSVPGTYQSILSPRFSNVDYGANIRYNMPTYENQATPCNPLTFGNMAKENYSENYGCGSCGGGCGSVGCKKGGASLGFREGAPSTESGFASGNYNQMLDSVYSDSSYPEVTSSLPVGDMTTINASGETIQPIIYDRYIYANRNSRLRSQGDPIRGDLPIVPCNADWFRPSVHPSIDLQEGAMNVMGGNQNETANALSDLIYTASGNADTTIGGTNMVNQLSGMNMTNQYSGTMSAGMRDVQMTAFP